MSTPEEIMEISNLLRELSDLKRRLNLATEPLKTTVFHPVISADMTVELPAPEKKEIDKLQKRCNDLIKQVKEKVEKL